MIDGVVRYGKRLAAGRIRGRRCITIDRWNKLKNWRAKAVACKKRSATADQLRSCHAGLNAAQTIGMNGPSMVKFCNVAFGEQWQGDEKQKTKSLCHDWRECQEKVLRPLHLTWRREFCWIANDIYIMILRINSRALDLTGFLESLG